MTTLNHVRAKSGLLHYGQEGIDDLYARVWGDSIHFGYYRDDFESIESACLEAKRMMAEAAAVGTGMTVLEVASGWGATARFLARDWGVRVTATNLEAAQLKTARLLTGLLGLGRLVSHIPADFQDLTFPPAAFDVWWCQESIVHARDKDRTLAEAHRVLKNGGRIVFSEQTVVREACSMTDRGRIAARHGAADLWSRDDFSAALARAGFRRIETMDWGQHMTLHLAKLVDRVDRNFAQLCQEIPEDVIRFNRDYWAFTRDLAHREAIGWTFFMARK